MNCSLKKSAFLLLSIILIAVVFSAGCSPLGGSPRFSSGVFVSGGDASAGAEPSDPPAPYDEGVTLSSVTDINDIPFIFVERFARLSSFSAKTEGKTTAVIGISTDQKIENQAVKSGDRYYSHALSAGLITSEHEAYFKGGKAFYRDGADGAFSTADIGDYLSVYGTYPGMGKSIEGYTIDADSVIGVARTEEENTFRITLSADRATQKNKVQMKKMGNLSDYPNFSSVELYLTIDEYFNPVKVRVLAKYTVPYTLIFTFYPDCTQDYTVTYSGVNGEVSFPADENFNNF